MATAKATKAAKGKQLLALVALALLVVGIAPQQLEASRYLPNVDVELKPLTVDATSTDTQPSLLATALEDLPSLAALSASTSTNRRLRLLEPPVVGAWGENLASGGFQPLSERISLAENAFRQESRIADYFLQPDPLGPIDSTNLYQAFNQWKSLEVSCSVALNGRFGTSDLPRVSMARGDRRREEYLQMRWGLGQGARGKTSERKLGWRVRRCES